MTFTKSSFEKIYRSEHDVKVKERMLLILNVVYGDRVSSYVARDLHRNRSWASIWLKSYDKEGIEGLRDRPKSGRHLEISAEIDYKIKTILRESSNQGWTTKQVEELIIKESGIRYHYTHIYHIIRKWGFKQKVPRKVLVNTTSKEEKEEFKKRSNKYLWVLPVPDTKNKIKRKGKSLR